MSCSTIPSSIIFRTPSLTATASSLSNLSLSKANSIDNSIDNLLEEFKSKTELDLDIPNEDFPSAKSCAKSIKLPSAVIQKYSSTSSTTVSPGKMKQFSEEVTSVIQLAQNVLSFY